MRAGLLRHRVTLQQQLFVQNPLGESVGDWVDFDTVYANAQPLRGREYFAAAVGQPEQKTDVRFTMRYRPGVTQSMRVVWNGVAHPIESVIHVDGRQRTLELMTVRDGPVQAKVSQDYGDASYFSEDEYYTTFQQQTYAAQNSYYQQPGYAA